MIKVFVINGYPGAGKDTFVELLRKKYDTVFNLHTSTPVKRAIALLGWEGGKSPEERNFMADMISQSDKLFDTSRNYIMKSVQTARNQQTVTTLPILVFIHSRELDNIDYYKEKYNAKTLLIDRGEAPSKVTNKSDLEVHSYSYDIEIDNFGTLQDLQKKVDNFILEHIEEV